jgi:hypothetical protein
VSSDLERRLKEFPAEFPRPADDVTDRVADQVRKLPPPRRPRRRWSTVALVAATLAGGTFVGLASIATATDSSTSAVGDPVISARVYKDGPSTYVELTGRIPSSDAGERVQILERTCGTREFRIASDTQTVAGGFWSLAPVFFYDSVTYVARWNGRLSDEAVLRAPIYLLPFPLGKKKWRLQVNTRHQTMTGRPVILQRRTASGDWLQIRRAKLKPLETFGMYGAVVSVKQRGLTLRGFLPQSSARPCHDAEVTMVFRSQ